MKNRSLSRMILAAVCFLSGTGMIVDAVHGSQRALKSLAGLRAERVLDQASYQQMFHKNQVMFPTVTALGAAWLIAGVGMLFQLSWSRLVALVCAGVSVLYELRLYAPSIVTHHIPFLGYLLTHASIKEFGHELLRDLYLWLRAALSIGWYGLLLWYLNHPHVKAQFQRRAN